MLKRKRKTFNLSVALKVVNYPFNKLPARKLAVGSELHRRGRGATPIYNNIMEPRWTKNVCMAVLWSGCLLCVIFVTGPAYAITVYADSEVIVQNGTTAVLRCTFDSSEVVTKATSVSWSFQSNQPDSLYYSAPYVILYFADGKAYPGQEDFKHRVQFVGDINKKDASLQLSPAQFSDNGTFFCDVKNPPDVSGTQGRTELRVVQKDESVSSSSTPCPHPCGKESLPQTNTKIVILAVCGALILLIAVAIAACFAVRVIQNRHDYEGCTSLEGASSEAPRPLKKAESSREGSRSTGPSGPLQVGAPGRGNPRGATISKGPVIYVQLDHSGSKNSFHKMEPVVYADIRKN
ncbi:myelin protein zero-like 1 like isoform X2 [Gambusia affinis]|uniref:myelin protein zero-like 1 like isoform X2 n=1 Tax=Gambusia affinis TaxID=33528 RepID=UPI001CDC4CD5|nr:myelin protein zero-like 1 like isoform X2 [Gambusia affinis]